MPSSSHCSTPFCHTSVSHVVKNDWLHVSHKLGLSLSCTLQTLLCESSPKLKQWQVTSS